MYFVLAAVLLVVAAMFFRKRRVGNLPPGPKGLPILGVALEMDMFAAHKTMSKWADRFGALFSVKVIGVHSVVMNDANLLRKAFADEEYKLFFNDRPDTFFGKHFVRYKDVAFASLESASRTRKVFHKGLHFYGEGVAAFESNITEELRRLVRELEEEEGRAMDPTPIIEASICMLIHTLLTGDHNTSEITKTRELITAFLRSVNGLVAIFVETLLQAAPCLRFVPGPLRTLYLNMITDCDRVREKYYSAQKKTYREGQDRGMVDYLLGLEKRQELTKDNVTGIIVDTLIGGVLTSTYAILWLLLLLLHHPDCADRVRAEVDAVVGRDRYPRFSDRPSMPYTEAVILEGLRYSSHIAFTIPHRCSKDVEFEGYIIPKGTQVLANLFYIHHDEKVWGDPWTFRPDRFLDEGGNLVSPTHPARQAFLTFSVGKRACVGESLAKSRLFLYIATLLQRFKLQPAKDLPSCDPRTPVGVGGTILPPTFDCSFISNYM